MSACGLPGSRSAKHLTVGELSGHTLADQLLSAPPTTPPPDHSIAARDGSPRLSLVDHMIPCRALGDRKRAAPFLG
ncbi:hypothetical protein PCASD_10200 [Puccinia coronata f. sp. avenae]|uniref:Uncharacterized protein n=1 Tax=Puccinia coronata f. sp. avenae TaxID=200324 RepID=A0A2N5UD60_9BASI|nr:hypothetical protein PCASD_10200 [Puccinia coronata f. sp. avenae]